MALVASISAVEKAQIFRASEVAKHAFDSTEVRRGGIVSVPGQLAYSPRDIRSGLHRYPDQGVSLALIGFDV